MPPESFLLSQQHAVQLRTLTMSSIRQLLARNNDECWLAFSKHVDHLVRHISCIANSAMHCSPGVPEQVPLRKRSFKVVGLPSLHTHGRHVGPPQSTPVSSYK